MSGPSSAAEFESLFADLARSPGPGASFAGGHLAGSLQHGGWRFWLFGPLWVRPVPGPGGVPGAPVLLQNGIVLQWQDRAVATLVGGTPEDPQDLVPAYGAGQFLRPGAAVFDDGGLKLLYGRYRSTGPGWWDVQRTGTSLAELDLREVTKNRLTLRSVTDLPVGPRIGWGSALLVHDGFTYVYGTSTDPGRMTFAHLARARVDRLAGPWEYWDGVDWAAEERHAVRLLSGVGHGFGVCRALRSVVVVSEEHHLPADRRLVLQAAGTPEGPVDHPFSRTRHLAEPDGLPPGEAVHSAAVHLVVEPTGDTAVDPPPPSTLVVSYHVREEPGEETPEGAGRPRFVDLRWPPAFPGWTDLPAPDGLTATGRDDHAELSWREVPGAVGYRVGMRDVTAGQIGCTPLPDICTTTGLRVGGLISGHRYLFTVASVSPDAEGEPGPAVEVTPHSSVPVEQAVEGVDVPNTVPDVYVILLEGRAAHRERIADYARRFAGQTGAALDTVFVAALQGFSLHGLLQQQAVDLAAHPDVEAVYQDSRNVHPASDTEGGSSERGRAGA